MTVDDRHRNGAVAEPLPVAWTSRPTALVSEPNGAQKSGPFPVERTAALQRGRPFQKGRSGNPTGRRRGSKNKLTKTFLEILAGDFARHGAGARLRERDPATYLRLVASIVPKELVVNQETAPDVDYAELTDEEFEEMMEAQRRRRIVAAAFNTSY